jgi:FkbM family methyltransferase
MSNLQKAQLASWFNTTSLPIPFPIRIWLINSLVGSNLVVSQIRPSGLKILLNLSDFLQAHLFIKYQWEPVLSNWVAFFAKRGQTFADVGSHIGYFSLLMSFYGKANYAVHAFEPNPDNFSQLEQNARLNGLNIKANPLAVIDKKRAVVLHMPHKFHGGMGRIGFLAHTHHSIMVETTSLDLYCEEHGVAGFDLIKMDIEGSEAEAILGMEQGIKQGAYKVLLLETHPAIVSAEKYAALQRCFENSGYRIYEIHLDYLKLSPSFSSGNYCVLSPQAFKDLGSPAGDFLLPEKIFN